MVCLRKLLNGIPETLRLASGNVKEVVARQCNACQNGECSEKQISEELKETWQKRKAEAIKLGCFPSTPKQESKQKPKPIPIGLIRKLFRKDIEQPKPKPERQGLVLIDEHLIHKEIPSELKEEWRKREQQRLRK